MSSRKISLIRSGEKSTSDAYFFQGGLPVVGALFGMFEEKCPNVSKVLRPLAALVKTVVVGQFEPLKSVIEVMVSAIETVWTWLGKLARAGGDWLKSRD